VALDVMGSIPIIRPYFPFLLQFRKVASVAYVASVASLHRSIRCIAASDATDATDATMFRSGRTAMQRMQRCFIICFAVAAARLRNCKHFRSNLLQSSAFHAAACIFFGLIV
jgi:hypothetical protein